MNKRIYYLDIVRGICIIYMIAGHIGFQSVEFDHYIHAFHMPIFFVIAGIFSKKISNVTEYLKKMSKKLLIPYFFWAFLIIIIDNKTTIGTHIGIKNGLKIVLTTNNNLIPIAGALWFLTSFYICHILFSMIQTYIKKETIKYFIIILMTIVGVYLYKFTSINIWWSMNSSLVGLGLMEIGYLLKKNNWLEKVLFHNNIILVGLIIINSILIMKTGYVNMRTNNYPNIILFLTNIIMSIIVYMNISIRMEKFTLISNWIKLLGKESIISLCLNQLIILIFNTLLYNYLFSIFGSYHIIIVRLIIFMASLITITLLTKYLKESKLKIIFGK